MKHYFVVDVEADGPVPGLYSMLSFSAVHYTELKEGHLMRPVDRVSAGVPQMTMPSNPFSVNLHRLPGAKVSADTEVFWDKNPDAWLATRKNLVDPRVGLTQFSDWLDARCPVVSDRILVANPAAFDAGYVNYYSHLFLDKSLFHYMSIDMDSLYAGFLGKSPTEVDLDDFARDNGIGVLDYGRQHIAESDARYQGAVFVRLWNSLKGCSFVNYIACLDELREQRRKKDWAPEQDRPILNRLTDWYAMLSEREQNEIEILSWRAWPDSFDDVQRGILADVKKQVTNPRRHDFSTHAVGKACTICGYGDGEGPHSK